MKYLNFMIMIMFPISAIITGYVGQKIKSTIEGYVVISIMTLLTIASIIMGLVSGWSYWEIGIYLVIQVMFVLSLIQSYKDGYEKVINKSISLIKTDLPDADMATYYLFKIGGFKVFKTWFAAVSNDVWFDLLATALFVLIMPFPFLSQDKSVRFEIFLAKLGIYKVTTAIFLGNPRFNPQLPRVPLTKTSLITRDAFYVIAGGFILTMVYPMIRKALK